MDNIFIGSIFTGVIMTMSKNLKMFMKYVIPSIIGMLITGSYCIVDSIFIGQYGGKIGLAAVAITWPLVMLFAAVGDMLGTGAAIIISQSRGKGAFDRARMVFGNMLCFQLVTSLLLMLPCVYYLTDILYFFGADDELMPYSLPYALIQTYGCLAAMLSTGLPAVIRNDGRPTLAMIIISFSLISNIIMDYLFIFKFSWGIVGASWATLTAQILISLMSLIYFATKYTDICYSMDMLRIKITEIREIIIDGIPSFGSQLAIITILFLHNYQSVRYGGVDGLAVYTFIGDVEAIGSLFMTGLALGVQPLVAFLYGSRRYARQEVIGRMGYRFAFVSGIVLMWISFLGRNIFPPWFNLHGEVAQLAAHGLIISSSAFLLLGVIRVAGYYFQATGKIMEASLLIYGDAFFALPLCLWILPLFFGLDGVWMAMPVSRILLFIFVCVLWLKERKKDWGKI